MDLFTLSGKIAIDVSGADKTIEATITAADDLKGLLDGIGTSADTTAGKLGSKSNFNTASLWMADMLSKLSEKALEVGINLGKIGFGFNMSIESYQYQFKALLNDADAAGQLVADLQELAKISPLGLEGLAGNAVSLLQTGIELADIIPTLEMLGNLSLGDTSHMDSVVRAYTQIISKGGLMAQEMYQLGDAMVPIVEIMTKYGGERYADGSWYQAKMKDPTYKIPAEDMIKAFQAATAEGGKWHDYMLTFMDSFAGQYDRLGEEGKETLGAFFQPFFDMAKENVLPNLTAALSEFRTWITENKETLDKTADAIGKLVSEGFDKLLGALKWMTENGESVGVALSAIATGMALGAIAAHPYAAAIMAVAAGLAWLTSEEGKQKRTYDHFFDGHDQEAMEALQEWVEAKRALKAADDDITGSIPADEYEALVDSADAAAQKVNALDGELMGLYEAWRSGQANSLEYLDVPFRVEEGTESAIQTELDGMSFEGVVKLVADTSGLPRELYSIAGVDVTPNAEGAIFSKPTIFPTRLGHQMVGEAGAEAVAPITKLQGYVSDAVKGAVGGMQFNVVLDTGVLVGQLAPGMDARLGTLAGRKGRRN